MTAPRIVVAGGHSAGHIEPAMNFADAVRRLEPNSEITALGTVRGLDTALIPARGYPLELIPPAPLSRKLDKALLATPLRLRDSVRAAGAVLDRTRAEALVGFGGYVAMPAYVAARRRRIPIVVHEANARPGVANRVAARLTPYVFTASAEVRLPHATSVGIPLRPAIAGLDRAALRTEATGRCPARRPSCAPPGCRCCTSSGRRTPSRCPRVSRRTWCCPSSSRCSTPTPPPTSSSAARGR
jgi:UDP-N-acetylglucosamine--N-acetylmuramyl-(pentapeptide) pyrophosphoryl-undecaprenol N-acetylglucosamine transferase